MDRKEISLRDGACPMGCRGRLIIGGSEILKAGSTCKAKKTRTYRPEGGMKAQIVA